MKKRTFTLLETLIVIFLSSLIFVFLFSKIREYTFLKQTLKKAELECLERERVHIRLNELFTHLLPSVKNGKTLAPIFSENNTLHFSSYVSMAIDSSSIGLHSYSIVYDPIKKKIELIESLDKGKEKRETLLTAAEEVHFEFFSKEECSWVSPWDPSRVEVPLYMLMRCKKNIGMIEFVFQLHEEKNP